MKEQHSKSNPFTDITSIDVPCQIENHLQTALSLCDFHIHYSTPKSDAERQDALWNIRIVVESALSKFNHIRD